MESVESVGRKMLDKCVKFAKWVKEQELEPTGVVNVWMSTCKPAVVAGVATKQYSVMCDAIAAAVEDFADDPNWTPNGACNSVLQAFHESGVGRSPVSE